MGIFLKCLFFDWYFVSFLLLFVVRNLWYFFIVVFILEVDDLNFDLRDWRKLMFFFFIFLVLDRYLLMIRLIILCSLLFRFRIIFFLFLCCFVIEERSFLILFKLELYDGLMLFFKFSRFFWILFFFEMFSDLYMLDKSFKWEFCNLFDRM